MLNANGWRPLSVRDDATWTSSGTITFDSKIHTTVDGLVNPFGEEEDGETDSTLSVTESYNGHTSHSAKGWIDTATGDFVVTQNDFHSFSANGDASYSSNIKSKRTVTTTSGDGTVVNVQEKKRQAASDDHYDDQVSSSYSLATDGTETKTKSETYHVWGTSKISGETTTTITTTSTGGSSYGYSSESSSGGYNSSGSGSSSGGSSYGGSSGSSSGYGGYGSSSGGYGGSSGSSGGSSGSAGGSGSTPTTHTTTETQTWGFEESYDMYVTYFGFYGGGFSFQGGGMYGGPGHGYDGNYGDDGSIGIPGIPNGKASAFAVNAQAIDSIVASVASGHPVSSSTSSASVSGQSGPGSTVVVNQQRGNKEPPAPAHDASPFVDRFFHGKAKAGVTIPDRGMLTVIGMLEAVGIAAESILVEGTIALAMEAVTAGAVNVTVQTGRYFWFFGSKYIKSITISVGRTTKTFVGRQLDDIIKYLQRTGQLGGDLSDVKKVESAVKKYIDDAAKKKEVRDAVENANRVADEAKRAAEEAAKKGGAKSGSPNAVNPNIPKAPVPPSSLFGGKIFQDWGKGVVNWGSGAKDALDRIYTLTKTEIQRLGITKAQAEAALNFYKHELLRNPGNATADARVKLMEYILSQL